MAQLHVVMTGSDTSPFNAGSDTYKRFQNYATILRRYDPESRLTYICVSKQPLEAHVTPSAEGLSLLFAPSIFKMLDLMKMIEEKRPISVITTQTCFGESWVSYVMTGRFDIPVIVQEHSDPFAPEIVFPTGFKARLRRIRYHTGLKLINRYAAAVRVVSPSIVPTLKEHYLRPNQPIAVLPVPVSVPTVPRAPSDGLQHLLYAGRFAPEKNPIAVMYVMAVLAQKFPQLRLDMVGEGALQPMLEALAQQLQITDKVTFHGWQSAEQLAQFYAKADVILVPSFYEGFCRVIIEAMSCGAAVVATQTAGADYLINLDKAGILVPQTDGDAMVDAIARILDDVPYQAELRARGYKTAARFEPQKLAEEWMDFLVQHAKKDDQRAIV